jgi:hypothetical protein
MHLIPYHQHNGKKEIKAHDEFPLNCQQLRKIVGKKNATDFKLPLG